MVPIGGAHSPTSIPVCPYYIAWKQWLLHTEAAQFLMESADVPGSALPLGY